MPKAGRLPRFRIRQRDSYHVIRFCQSPDTPKRNAASLEFSRRRETRFVTALGVSPSNRIWMFRYLTSYRFYTLAKVGFALAYLWYIWDFFWIHVALWNQMSLLLFDPSHTSSA